MLYFVTKYAIVILRVAAKHVPHIIKQSINNFKLCCLSGMWMLGLYFQIFFIHQSLVALNNNNIIIIIEVYLYKTLHRITFEA